MGKFAFSKIDALSKLLLLLGFLVMVYNANAQGIKVFTPNPEEYLEEVTKFLEESDKKRTKKFMEERFIPFWSSTQLTDKQRDDIYKISNVMLKKGMNAYPELHAFLNTAIGLENSTQSTESYNAWSQSVYVLIDKKRFQLSKFLTSCSELFENNTIYSSPTTVWRASRDTFEFVFDSIPKIVFYPIDLTCYAKRDSSTIKETRGVYLPLTQEWVGEGGKVTWERAGLDPGYTYAQIYDYRLKMKKSEYKIDSVQFFNGFFLQPLLGVLEEKVLANVTPEKATYPLFQSYDKRLEIPELFQDIDYEGGFTMRGGKLIGSGSLDHPAKLMVYRDDVPFMVAKSQTYIIQPGKVNSDDTQVSFFLSRDSITHPSLSFKYIEEDNQLTLVRTEEGVSKAPFYDSYHNLDLYFEALYWKLDEEILELGNLYGATQKRAAFESKDYYNEKRYYAIQGPDDVSPLIRVRGLTRKLGDYTFTLDDFVKHTRLPKSSAQKMLIMLTNQGFLTYDLNRDVVVVRQKLEDYIKNRAGKKDYDALLFNSRVDQGENANINLINYDMLLKGVSRIVLSDSQDVKIYPDRKEVTVKQNRRFLFDGVVYAGNLEFYAQGNDFDYEEFKIEMSAIDSMRIKVKSFDKDEEGRRRTVAVTNVLEGLSGTLYVDEKNNKSGLKNEEFSQYPIFDSKQDSYVYYDKSDIQKGAYDRESFYYQVEPFTLDSLDNFKTEEIEFDGVLVSAGIFPDLIRPLKVQPDYSLGFEIESGADGLAAYGGVGKFTSTVSLNGNGLQGAGDLEFLTSLSTSEQFVFLPDSTLGQTTGFTNTERKTAVQVPEANGTVLDLVFKPKKELLTVSTLKDSIGTFNGQADLMGDLTLKPAGMTGSGLMTIEDAEITSNLFEYNANDFHADTAAFNLVGAESQGFSFKTDFVSADVDFNQRKAVFKAINEASFVEFPDNQYVCYMDKFTWFMDENDLALEYDGKVSSDFVIDTDLDLTKSNFFSVRPDQDSLQFMAPGAVYDIDESIIKCNGIEYIRVADAKILPDSGKVVIRKRAKMDPLLNAEILATATRELHHIYDATLSISSRKKYDGEGMYTYKDEDGTEYIFTLDAISVDENIQTVASGVVSEEDEFSLSPAFQYYGDVLLYANDENLTFDGYTRIIHDCDLNRDWMKFSAEVNPKEIYIPIDSTLTDEINTTLSAGVLLGGIPVDMYTTFLSAAEDKRDHHILKTFGDLYFNKKENAYQITTREKHKERSLPGDFVSLSLNTCNVSGEGKFDFGVNLGQVEFKPVGTVSNNTDTESFDYRTAIPIKFPMNKSAVERMQTKMQSYPSLDPLKIEGTSYENSLRELIGLERTDKIMSELTLSGKIKKLPDEIQSTIYIADVKFKWNSDAEAYVSVGKIGIANIGDKEIFSYVKGNILIEKKKGGDILSMYLELDEDNWYFFTYARTVMQAYSTDAEFNSDIMNTKENDRKFKGSKGMENYSYMLGSKKKKVGFLNKLEDL